MNADMKSRWLEALRSGDYTQGKGSLKYTRAETDFFCCWGVLCDLFVADGAAEWRNEVDGFAVDTYIKVIDIDSDGKTGGGYPPEPLLRKAEIESSLDDGDLVIKLARMNDQGAPFSEIATWVERNL